GGRFALQGFDSPGRMLRQGAGGLMMGAGGATALGCSIGQGLTGLSTLALPSLAAVAGILAGAFVGLRGPLAGRLT
ncbi:MAG: YeeE/YedE family protein, partial [Gammaproteobacteria bacterium]|nr:YeeE/YedE family protein [Gammaproteobacteria bacterium]